MARRVTTAGMYLCYAVETTAGTRPTTGYAVVPEVKSMPDFNPAPELVESTTLLETEFRTYEQGLKSFDSALEFTANLTDALETLWDETIVPAYETAAEAGKAMWWAIVHPKLAKATFFTGVPSLIGLDAAEVGNMAETTLYITPTSAPKKYGKPELETNSQTVLGGNG